MSDDPQDPNDDKKAKLGFGKLGGLLSKAKKAIPNVMKKKKSEDDEELEYQEDVYDEEYIEEDFEETLPSHDQTLSSEPTIPTFQVSDDDFEDSEIDRTLQNINVEEVQSHEGYEDTYDEEEDEDRTLQSADLEKLQSEQQEYSEGVYAYDDDFDEDTEVGQKSSSFSIASIAGKLLGAKKTSTLKSKITRRTRQDDDNKGNRFNLYQTVFSPDSRPQIHRTFILLFFIGGAIFSARLIATYLNESLKKVQATSKAPMTIPSSNKKQLKERITALNNNDLFKAQKVAAAKPKKPQKPVVDKDLVCINAQRRSSEGLKLLQTIVLQDSVKSIASVQVRGKGKYLRIGDRISGIAEIGNIASGKLIFKNLKTGKCEYVDKPSKGKSRRPKINVEKNLAKGRKMLKDAAATGILNEGNNFKIKKSFRDKAMSNMSELITQARAVQIKNPDGTLSFRMQEIVPGSLYSKLDVQNGDIINSINGKKFTNLNEIMGLLGKLKDNDHFEMSIKRGGVEMNREFDFVE